MLAPTEREVALAIVGGGAAGMFAAAVAAERHIPCLLVERKARLGSKVLMTANGRCNFTKDIDERRFLGDIGARSGEFAASAVRECPPRHVISLFKSLGVPLRRMNDGRMFPADGKAATIVHAFGDAIRDAGVPVLSNCAVTAIRRRESGFLVETGGFSIAARNVLVATGGMSFPKTGSVGDGQRFAQELGHRIVPMRAGLTGLETADRRIVGRAGRRFECARAIVFGPGGDMLFSYSGEVDCESFGLSGAAIYNAQRFIASEGLGEFTLDVSFDGETMRFRNLRPRPLKEAIVTLGGVSLGDVDCRTMMSRKVPGLYFAGEVLDLDGPTGGYNLTLAFATARKAVVSCGKSTGRSQTA